MSQQPEDSVGLDLFDETASAAGSFPHSMLGYERQAVDAYIRDIERQLSSAKRKVRSLQKQVSAKSDETDFSRLGTHTGDLMRAAESQAKEILEAAKLDAARIVADANTEADALTTNAHQGVAQDRVRNLDDLNRLRDELTGQTGAELALAQEEARQLRDAADTHRAMVLADAERNAQSMRDQAGLEAERIRQAAHHEAADIRARLAQEHADALDILQRRQDEVTAQLAELSERARRQSEELGQTMAADANALTDRRNKAMAEADQIVVAANEQARALVAEGRANAAKREREAGLVEAEKLTQLNHDIARLSQRRNALLEALRRLSAVATSSVDEFHDEEPSDAATAQLEAVAGELEQTNEELTGPIAQIEPEQPADQPAHSEAGSDAAATSNDDDATRVQPAASGGRDRR